MATNEPIENIDEEPETFKDIARICVKKNNKGPFDDLITSLYRLNQLAEYFPHIDPTWDEKTVLIKCISQGMKFKNFASFKAEVEQYSGFHDIAECDSMKDFYLLLKQDENDEPIQKKLLRRTQGILHDHEFGLQFLKNWVSREVEKLENQAKQLQNK